LASRLPACEITIGSDLAATPVIKPEGRPLPPIAAHAAASQPRCQIRHSSAHDGTRSHNTNLPIPRA
jgi:hypothetical protein